MRRTSRHQDNLSSTDNPPHAYYFDQTVDSEKYGSYTLEGRILSNNPDTTISVMYVHGARADYSKGDRIFLPLHNLGINLLGTTVSGHGVTGLRSDMPFSLDDNLNEAQTFSENLSGKHQTLIGLSMGGTTVVRLIQNNPNKFDKLILFYPAVFSDEVYSIPFGTDDFRSIASKKGGFLSSSFFEVIKNFSGKIMLIKGEYDGLDPAKFNKPNDNSAFTVELDGQEVYSPIPPEVFSKILELRPDTVFLEVKGADHQFAKWAQSHEKEASDIATEIYNFISS